ncbi:hypothetical protein BDY19DRAFT_910814 [Irpex rosettiformis]|uniref:Uncharacterized protein n=1 Tax=Irpex rosettiformis TaxID=378272 RepID=A0ACB8TMB9_9APHY|nr:hypothetical protein BDY19DRAFT_910814 [Irpex rosettiformis]
MLVTGGSRDLPPMVLVPPEILKSLPKRAGTTPICGFLWQPFVNSVTASLDARHHGKRLGWQASPLAQLLDHDWIHRHYHLHTVNAEDIATLKFTRWDSEPVFFSVTGQLSRRDVVFETVPGLNGQPSPSSNTHVAFWVESRPDDVSVRDWSAMKETLERLAARSTVHADLSTLCMLDEHGSARIRVQGTKTRSEMQLVRLGSRFSWYDANGNRLSISARGQVPFGQCDRVVFQLKHARQLGAGAQLMSMRLHSSLKI